MAETLRDEGDGRGRPAPWVIVAGGFDRLGGMDKANAALAAYLLGRGRRLHLVAHRVSRELAEDPRVTVHIVPRPARSFLLGEQMLARRGRAVAAAVSASDARARVLTNGGNCAWPGINWVHSVHHAWPTADGGSPAWFRVKNRLAKSLDRSRERRAITAARVLIANSERTKRDLVEHLSLDPRAVRTVYLGGDPSCAAATVEEREAARAWLGVADSRPLVAFVGALGYDRNKGFDTLLRAWKALCAKNDWDAELVVAGGGGAVPAWRAEVAAEGLGGRVKLLGFSERVGEVLAASDLLVSPARYEAYGLNVREAICRGVPALVSGCAGVAEHYGPELDAMLLPRPDDARDLASRLRRWRSEISVWKERFAPLSAALRRRTWDEMAAEIFSIVETGETAQGLDGTAASRAA